ncbi:MAG: hypothetical protein JW866_06630 [Ignavibacteriales bacterium]|nr:hypothetical protein [Ignavibacteriales bacterium]
MKLRKAIFDIAILIALLSCSEDNNIVESQQSWLCGTVPDTRWTQYVTNDSLIGSWTITTIQYSKGQGQVHLFDTSYNLNAPLILNPYNSGTIYSLPLNWILTASTSNSPRLIITNIDTLFPFKIKFIHNNIAEIYPQSPPSTKINSGFFATAGKGEKGQWEQVYISFRRN